jgi:hypothetical protein
VAAFQHCAVIITITSTTPNMAPMFINTRVTTDLSETESEQDRCIMTPSDTCTLATGSKSPEYTTDDVFGPAVLMQDFEDAFCVLSHVNGRFGPKTSEALSKFKDLIFTNPLNLRLRSLSGGDLFSCQETMYRQPIRHHNGFAPILWWLFVPILMHNTSAPSHFEFTPARLADLKVPYKLKVDIGIRETNSCISLEVEYTEHRFRKRVNMKTEIEPYQFRTIRRYGKAKVSPMPHDMQPYREQGSLTNTFDYLFLDTRSPWRRAIGIINPKGEEKLLVELARACMNSHKKTEEQLGQGCHLIERFPKEARDYLEELGITKKSG